ncbi:MAG: hypothetical protein ACPG4C_06675, partial [Schleiferiaceae bacterium]
MRKLWSYIHHIWYYFCALTSILLLLLPLLLFARPSAKYGTFFKIGKLWSRIYLLLMGIVPRPKKYELKHKGPYVLAA